MTVPDLLLAGEIGKPHGTSGDVYVVRISDDPHRFDAGARLLHDDGRTLVVEKSRAHRNRFLVKFEGIESREDAAALRGSLFVPASEVRELEDGEYWEHELIGCNVVDQDGSVFGTVSAIIRGTAQDLLEVETEAGERLVPMVEQIIVEMSPEQNKIVVSPPAGLFE